MSENKIKIKSIMVKFSLYEVCVYPFLFNVFNHLFYCQICGMSHTRGKEVSKYWPQAFKSEEEK